MLAETSWNYRVVRYAVQGVDLFGIVEVYYSAGEPTGYAPASVEGWETVDDLQGTVARMAEALAKPVLDVSPDQVPWFTKTSPPAATSRSTTAESSH
jgi:hypothetical protein